MSASVLQYYVNLQAYCEEMLTTIKTQQMGLSTSAQLLEIDEDGLTITAPWATACSPCAACKSSTPESLTPLCAGGRCGSFTGASSLRPS